MGSWRSIEEDSFYDGSYELIKDCLLNKTDIKENNNKFYKLELHSNNIGEYRVQGRYGRVGCSKPQVIIHGFTNLSAAERQYDSILQKKTQKGYAEIAVVSDTVGSDVATTRVKAEEAKISENTEKATAENSKVVNLHPSVMQLVKRIYEEANAAVSYGATGSVKGGNVSPLGSLGVSTIRKGREYLEEILEAINTDNRAGLVNLNSKYLSIIPRTLGGNLRLEADAIMQGEKSRLVSTVEQVQQEYDLLDIYETSIELSAVSYSSDMERKYSALNTTIELVEGDEYNRIKDYVLNTCDKTHHRYELKVKNIYSIDQTNAPKLDSRGKVMELFHGSRGCNITGILSKHLKLPVNLGSTVHITGAMFGPGLYFADRSTKSANYAFGSWGGARNKHDIAYLFVVQVGVGKQYKVSTSEYFRSAPKGYDSVFAEAGRHLYNNEFIVYNENQARITHLVEVTKG